MYLVYSGWFEKIRNAYFSKVIKKYTKRKDKILDYGCGPGDFLVIAQSLDREAHGIDKYRRSVELAKDRNLRVIQGDYLSLGKKFKEEAFDCIFLQSVLEHIRDPIEELNGLLPYLKKGGVLIVSSPTPGDYFWDDPTHVRPYTPKSFYTLGDILSLKTKEVNYVFSFLVGLHVTSSLVYRLINLQPVSLGSNIIGVYEK